MDLVDCLSKASQKLEEKKNKSQTIESSPTAEAKKVKVKLAESTQLTGKNLSSANGDSHLRSPSSLSETILVQPSTQSFEERILKVVSFLEKEHAFDIQDDIIDRFTDYASRLQKNDNEKFFFHEQTHHEVKKTLSWWGLRDIPENLKNALEKDKKRAINAQKPSSIDLSHRSKEPEKKSKDEEKRYKDDKEDQRSYDKSPYNRIDSRGHPAVSRRSPRSSANSYDYDGRRDSYSTSNRVDYKIEGSSTRRRRRSHQ